MKLRFKLNVPDFLDRIFAWPVLICRRLRFGYPYRRVRLTEDKYAIVDPQNFYWLNKFDWSVKGLRGRIYAVRFDNYSKFGRTISMHREIINAPKGLLVDHHNDNPLDNRLDNLRLATRSQNCCNSRLDKSRASSRFRGVTFRKKSGKWVANIRRDGKKLWLGSFDSELSAAKAYDRAAMIYHGEFARINFSKNEYTNDIRPS